MDKTTIGIVGTGMIASSLAVLCGGHGVKCILFARSQASVDRCNGNINDFFLQMKDKKGITDETIRTCRSYISYTFEYSGLAEADMVFECVSEDLDVKYGVYKELEDNCPNLKAIASVSSSIVPDELAKGCTKYADRVMVTHPFNPPHMVPYFELCGSQNTPDSVMDYVVSILEMMDRKPVVLNRPTPGFIGNRLQFALWREALALVEEGICKPEDIDTCLNYSFCPRYTSIGIFEHFDNGGLILNASACKNIWPILSNKTEIPEFMEDLINEGKLGPRSETKEGFYNWNGVDMDAFSKRVTKPYWALLDWKYPDKPAD